jgi:hypothetical protein
MYVRESLVLGFNLHVLRRFARHLGLDWHGSYSKIADDITLPPFEAP